jgi:hypothetical protein
VAITESYRTVYEWVERSLRQWMSTDDVCVSWSAIDFNVGLGQRTRLTEISEFMEVQAGRHSHRSQAIPVM